MMAASKNRPLTEAEAQTVMRNLHLGWDGDAQEQARALQLCRMQTTYRGHAGPTAMEEADAETSGTDRHSWLFPSMVIGWLLSITLITVLALSYFSDDCTLSACGSETDMRSPIGGAP